MLYSIYVHHNIDTIDTVDTVDTIDIIHTVHTIHISGYKLYLTSSCKVSLQEMRNPPKSLGKQAKIRIPDTHHVSIWPKPL